MELCLLDFTWTVWVFVSCNMIVSRTHAFISVLSGWHGWVSQQQIQALCGHFLPDLWEEMSAGIQCVWLESHCLFIVRLFCSQVGTLENCCYPHIALPAWLWDVFVVVKMEIWNLLLSVSAKLQQSWKQWKAREKIQVFIMIELYKLLILVKGIAVVLTTY